MLPEIARFLAPFKVLVKRQFLFKNEKTLLAKICSVPHPNYADKFPQRKYCLYYIRRGKTNPIKMSIIFKVFGEPGS